MFLEGNIGAPPTLTVISAKLGTEVRVAKAIPAAAAPNRTNLVNFIASSC